MSLTSNPSYVLGATPSDDSQRIMALANDRRPDGNEVAIREARSTLLTPRKGLAAEIAWLPRLEEDEVRRALAATERPGVAPGAILLPALARANLMANGLVEADSETVFNLAAWWLVVLATAHDRIRADKVSTLDGIAIKVDAAEDRESHTHASESSAHAGGTRTARPASPRNRRWGCLLFWLLFVVVLIAGYIAAIFT